MASSIKPLAFSVLERGFAFQPSKQYRLDFHKTMYAPLATSKAEVKFSERSANPANVTKLREQSETVIGRLKLKDPWHRYVQ